MSDTIIVEPVVNNVTNIQETNVVVTEPVVNTITVVEENKIVTVSATGAEGPVGPAGKDGTNGGSYAFEQQTLASTWTINHNLGYRPAVYVQDYGNNNLECDIQHSSVNTVVLNFVSAVTGYAYLT